MGSHTESWVIGRLWTHPPSRFRPHTQSVNGKITRTLYGMEVGCLMDFKEAKYAKTHNWQQGFGMLYVDEKKVSPVLIPIENKSFVVEGHRYSW